MSIELTFGGPKARAYQQLSSNLEHKIDLFVGTKSRKTFLIPKIRSNHIEQPYLIVDNKFIDLENIEYIAKKVKGLGRPKAIDLLAMFGSVDGIRKAGELDLRQIKGIGKKLANRIKQSL